MALDAVTVTVVGEDRWGRTRGAGVRTELGTLTAAHVVASGTGRLGGGLVEVVWADRATDLALLCDASADRPALPLGGMPERGDEVRVAGFYRGGPYREIATTVAHVNPGHLYGFAGQVVVLADPVAEGFSGGPVVDADGRLVAVVVANERQTGMGLAVPVTGLAADVSC